MKLLFFHAAWCPPCKNAQKNVINPLKEKYSDLITEIDVDADWQTPKKYGVCQVPAVIILEKENEVYRKVGIPVLAELEAILNDSHSGGPNN